VRGPARRQKTMANAVEISTGGRPHFMILEQEG
jgi:hypothetical protein